MTSSFFADSLRLLAQDPAREAARAKSFRGTLLWKQRTKPQALTASLASARTEELRTHTRHSRLFAFRSAWVCSLPATVDKACLQQSRRHPTEPSTPKFILRSSASRPALACISQLVPSDREMARYSGTTFTVHTFSTTASPPRIAPSFPVPTLSSTSRSPLRAPRPRTSNRT